MDTCQSPIDLSSSPALPAYLARHVRLDFDSEDLNALLDSIDSSQRGSQDSLPHLPAEILLHILEHVPSDYVINLRLVCRGFRDYIDTHLLYSYLHRTELFCFFGRLSFRTYPLSLEELERFKTMRMSFSHTEDSDAKPTAFSKRPKWDAKYAVYRIDPEWCRIFDTLRQLTRSQPALVNEWQLLAEIESTLTYDKRSRNDGRLGWAFKLDRGVLDLDITSDKVINLEKKTLTIQWKEGLLKFLRTENRLRVRKWKRELHQYTYNHAEDCLRQIRREWIQSLLDPDDSGDKRICWEMRILRPLFGEIGYAEPSQAYSLLKVNEDQAIRILMLLRKEASMSKRERERLEQLAKDRIKLIQDLSSIDTSFTMFKNQISDVGDGNKTCCQSTSQAAFLVLPINVLEWDEETVLKESKRVARWKSQKQTIENIKILLDGANEALSLPDDAFDSDS